MKKWNLVIDVAKCSNCNLCTLALHDEYFGNEFPGYAAAMPKHGHRWIEIRAKERGACPMVEVVYLPVTCNHCDEAPCVKAAQDGAVVKRADGIVIIVPEKAQGQKALVDACPYGAIWWNADSRLPQAWPFDAHLIDAGWTKTRGAQVCPTGAMRSLCVEDGEMREIARKERLEVLHPEYGTRPRVYYRNLDRWRKAFVGGSLAGPIGGMIECAAGVRVALEKDGGRIAETTSDAYGDWRIDGLEEGSGRYRLSFSDARFAAHSLEFELGESRYLGTIHLQPGG